MGPCLLKKIPQGGIGGAGVGGGGRGGPPPPKKIVGGGGGGGPGLSPPCFGPENIGNETENWFGKIFRLVIVYKWSRLAKYYNFLGLFEQLHPDFSEHLEELQRSCFGTDIDCGGLGLGHQLYHVHDAVRTTLCKVRQVTNIRTVWEAFNNTPVTETLLREVHKLLRLYLTFIPVASATSEHKFSSLRRLKTYLRSTMNKNRLSNCLLLHCHR